MVKDLGIRGFFKSLGKMILVAAAALAGIAGGLWVHSSFMLVEAADGSMLPLIEPGQVVAVRLNSGDGIEVGDLIVCELPFYETAGGGRYVIRRVEGLLGERVQACCGSDFAGISGNEQVFEREDILGKVIYYG